MTDATARLDPRVAQQVRRLFESGGRPRPGDRLEDLAQHLEALGHPTTPGLLGALVEGLGNSSGDADFMAVCEAFPKAVQDDDFLLGLAQLRHDPEAAAAAGELARFLLRRGCEDANHHALLDLLRALPDRAAVKRYEAALNLLEEHRIRVDPLDNFVIALIEEDADWLRFATTELGRLGRSIDRLSLVKLRERAPDSVLLGRYFRAAQALAESGMTLEQIDELVFPYLENDSKIGALAAIGHLANELCNGALTAKCVAGIVAEAPDAAAVRRRAQALVLLRRLHLPDSDVVLLASDFMASRDDIQWLEAFVARAQECHFKADRLGLVRIREHCHDVADLYNYMRLQVHGEALPAEAREAFDAIALDAARSRERTEALIELLERIAEAGYPARFDFEGVRQRWLR